MPVAVVVGEEDYATPIAMGKALHDAIRNRPFDHRRRAASDADRMPGQDRERRRRPPGEGLMAADRLRETEAAGAARRPAIRPRHPS